MSESGVLPDEVKAPLWKLPPPSSSSSEEGDTVAAGDLIVDVSLSDSGSENVLLRLFDSGSETVGALELKRSYRAVARLLEESTRRGTEFTPHSGTRALSLLSEISQLHNTAAALRIDGDAQSLFQDHQGLVHHLAGLLAQEGLRRGVIAKNRLMAVSRFVDPEEDRQELVITQYVNLPFEAALVYWDELGDAIEKWSRTLSPENRIALNTTIAINVESIE